jgi:hypothetical protein
MDKDIREIKKIITENLEDNLEFIPHETARIKDFSPNHRQETGFLFRTFTLFWMLNWTKLSEGDQDNIWEVLDELSAKRQIKIFRCEIARELNVKDIGLMAEIGKGIKEWGSGAPIIIHKFFYWQPGNALSKTEYTSGGKTIEKPSELVRELREQRDIEFRRAFGWRNFEIERQLNRQEVEAEAAYRRDVEKIAKWIDKQEKIEKSKNA